MNRTDKKSGCFPAAVSAALSLFCFLGLRLTRFYLWLLPAVIFCAVAVFLFLRYIKKRCAKKLPRRIMLAVQLIFAVVCFAAALWFVLLQFTGLALKNDPPPEGPDYVVVLGAKIVGDRPSNMLKKRLDTAFDYVSGNPAPRIILCGGQGADESFSEAEVMAAYLEKRGVDPERLVIEDASSDTRENLANARALMEGDDPSVLVISNGFHLSRAKLLARQLGFEIGTLAAPGNDDPFVELSYRLREFCGIAVCSLGLR